MTAPVAEKKKIVELPQLVSWGSDEWREQSKCRGAATELFFPPIGKANVAAQALCLLCPSRLPCAQFAVVNALRCGTYGGLSPKDRRRMKADTIKLQDVMTPISKAVYILKRGTLDSHPIGTLAGHLGKTVDWVEDKIINDGDYLI